MLALAASTAVITTAAPAAADVSPAGASGCTLSPTDGTLSTNGTITRTLGARTYQLHVPEGLAGADVPLLLSLHGAGSVGYEDEIATGWSQYADANDFIVAYPDAVPSGAGVWDAYTQQSPDVAFLTQVANDISATWCIDPHRIYVDGWSNGAVMSQRAACDAAATFAAVTSYDGGTPTHVLGAPTDAGAAPCTPSRPISVGLLAGQLDFTYTGLAANAAEWQGYDQCSTSDPTTETDGYGSTVTYACASGTQLMVRTVSNATHLWPSGAQGEDQRDRMWAFFEANPLP